MRTYGSRAGEAIHPVNGLAKLERNEGARLQSNRQERLASFFTAIQEANQKMGLKGSKDSLYIGARERLQQETIEQRQQRLLASRVSIPCMPKIELPRYSSSCGTQKY